MKKWHVPVLSTLALAVFAWTAAAQPATTVPAAAAEKAAPAKADAPDDAVQAIKVGIYVLNLGKLDISSGAFTVDFYLDLKSDKPIAENGFEFMNGRAATMEKIEDKKDGETYEKFYRIQANLSTPIDLKRYPFDSQKMQIILENKTESMEKVKYVPSVEESGLDQAINFPGWLITGWTATMSEHDYPVYNEKYCQYIYNVDIQRVKWNAFLKTFLPVFFMMLIVMASFILNPEQITTRLAAISSALVASVMFHVAISNQLPPVGYLTFADKFMVLTYLVLLVSFFTSIRVFQLQGRNDKEKAGKLHRLTERLVFTGMPALYVGLFLLVH